eukprot:5177870-Alexandrium_andersonii.AAC.1
MSWFFHRGPLLRRPWASCITRPRPLRAVTSPGNMPEEAICTTLALTPAQGRQPGLKEGEPDLQKEKLHFFLTTAAPRSAIGG